MIFEGSEEKYLHCLDDEYFILTDEIAADMQDLEWGGIKTEYYCNIVIDNPNLKIFADPDFMQLLIKHDGYFFKFASHELQHNREFVKTSVGELGVLFNDSLEAKYGCPLEYVPEVFRDDEEIVTIAISEDPNALQFASERLKSSREFILEAIDINPYNLIHASTELLNDKNLIRNALSGSPGWLVYAIYVPECKRLFCDEERLHGNEIFEHLNDDLKSDREFILEIVKLRSFALINVREDLKNDREIILAALSDSGAIIQYLSPEFQDDEEIVILALKKNGYFLRYASDRLKSNKDIVLLAIKNDPKSIEYAATEFLDDTEIITTHQQEWDKYSQKNIFLHTPIHHYSNPPEYKICCINTFGIDHSDKDIIAIRDDGLGAMSKLEIFKRN